MSIVPDPKNTQRKLKCNEKQAQSYTIIIEKTFIYIHNLYTWKRRSRMIYNRNEDGTPRRSTAWCWCQFRANALAYIYRSRYSKQAPFAQVAYENSNNVNDGGDDDDGNGDVVGDHRRKSKRNMCPVRHFNFIYIHLHLHIHAIVYFCGESVHGIHFFLHSNSYFPLLLERK